MKYFLSNYETGTSAAINPNNTVSTNSPAAVTTRENLRANNYFEQRARIQYTAKANDDLKLVTHFELDSVFGDRAQSGSLTAAQIAAGGVSNNATRGQGGALEADAVNLETKNVYLDFNIPSTPVNVKAGIQPYKDAFKGVFLDADIAGVRTVSTFGPVVVGLAYFRAYDQSYFTVGTAPNTITNPNRGMYNLDILALDTSFAITKDLKVGASYYLYSDDRSPYGAAVGSTNIHTLGGNIDAKVGPLGLSGFAAMQQGLTKGLGNNRVSYNGYAFNGAAKLAIGPGTLRTAGLWTTGDDGKDGINTAWQSVRQTQNQINGPATNSYNDSHMMLLNRDTSMEGTTTDQSLVYTTNNNNQGVILATLGYDASITPKLYANGNIGFAWVSKTNPIKPTDKTVGNGKQGGSNFQGTEINLETGYKMYDNLTASVQAAYVFLGGYYTDTVLKGNGSAVTPENPYTARVVLSYAF